MSLLADLMKQHHYPASLIFNFDETMVYPGKRRGKLIVRSKGPRPITKILSKGEHITFGICVAADGGKVDPLLILPLQTLPDLPQTLLQFYSVTGQTNGWITENIYELWIRGQFIPYVQDRRAEFGLWNQKALLIVDGHSSRNSDRIIQLLRSHDIDELVLPAHSSTILQPLDLSVNGEFKRKLGENFKQIEGEPADQRRLRLLAVSALALEATLTTLTITKGFSRAGIWPFSAQAPLNSSLIINPIDSIVNQRPKRKKRGPNISGTLLTARGPVTSNPLPSYTSTQQLGPPPPYNYVPPGYFVTEM